MWSIVAIWHARNVVLRHDANVVCGQLPPLNPPHTTTYNHTHPPQDPIPKYKLSPEQKDVILTKMMPCIHSCWNLAKTNKLVLAQGIVDKLGFQVEKRERVALTTLLLKWRNKGFEKLQMRSDSKALTEAGWFDVKQSEVGPLAHAVGNFVANTRQYYASLHALLAEKTGGGEDIDFGVFQMFPGQRGDTFKVPLKPMGDDAKELIARYGSVADLFKEWNASVAAVFKSSVAALATSAGLGESGLHESYEDDCGDDEENRIDDKDEVSQNPPADAESGNENEALEAVTSSSRSGKIRFPMGTSRDLARVAARVRETAASRQRRDDEEEEDYLNEDTESSVSVRKTPRKPFVGCSNSVVSHILPFIYLSCYTKNTVCPPLYSTHPHALQGKDTGKDTIDELQESYKRRREQAESVRNERRDENSKILQTLVSRLNKSEDILEKLLSRVVKDAQE